MDQTVCSYSECDFFLLAALHEAALLQKDGQSLAPGPANETPNINQGRALVKDMTNSFNSSTPQTTAEGGVPTPPVTYIYSVELRRTKEELECCQKRRYDMHIRVAGCGWGCTGNVERNEKGENPDPGQGKRLTS